MKYETKIQKKRKGRKEGRLEEYISIPQEKHENRKVYKLSPNIYLGIKGVAEKKR